MESFNPNRHLKEEFVSNLTGSSKLEIFFLVTNLSILILIRRCIGFNWINIGYHKKGDNVAGGGKSFEAYVAVLLIDFLCIVVPYVLFVTVLAEWTYQITILVLLLLFFLRAYHSNRPSFLQEGGVDSIRENVSSYRVATMLITCISILAVDFKIFPRRYAKTETYGTSLMDLGVGSFVVANALVSRQARGISNMKLSNGLRSTSPLIILGFARLISTSSVNYQKLARTRVWALCMFFWTLTLLLDWYVEAVSRRTCNMAYVSLILASSLQVLAIVMLFDYVPGCKNSAVEEAFSRNMLASFLLANVLTGLVNLSVDTLSASPISALAILFAYAFVLCFAVGFADFLGIRLKFW